ncbi:hypothetical protein GTE46_004593 [Salmonella enterica subsp. enterica]|nr:hypothetical protein [Salmonella enterica subsp. diarizonae]EDY2187878.1 hypothetical protein [Salmonella enterica subsp. enterica]EEC0216885.1 hypothetical protein [Salmonella enterica]HBP7554505.1 hypothetical protein [Salmonella enterica subsp. enterica serovar Infantis]EDY2803117.1 hypothetical protein [Salmonella enterica subsp. enterica]
MSDKLKRYPDNDRNNDGRRIGHGQQIIPDHSEPLSSDHKPCVIPRPDDKGKDSGK